MAQADADRIRDIFAKHGVPELSEEDKVQMAKTQAELAEREARKAAHPAYTPAEDYSYDRPQSSRNTAVYDLCELDPAAERIG